MIHPQLPIRSHRQLAVPAAMLLVLLFLALRLVTLSGPAAIPNVVPNLAQMGLAFVPRAEADTYTAGSGVVLSPGGISLALPRTGDSETIETSEVTLSFIGANPSPLLEPDDRLATQVNELKGSDPAQWRLQVPAYGGLTYHQLYPGIDLHYSGSEGQLKGTYTVAAGADPAAIRWRYDAAASLSVSDSGDLKVAVDGRDTLTEMAPVAWQEFNDQRRPVSAAYVLAPDGSAGFALGRYDASRPLIIDPTIAYETVYSADFLDIGVDITVDSVGQAWVVGYTLNTQDAVVLKLDAAGNVLFATFLQGSAIDEGHSIKVDAQGNPVIVGRTLSADFPVLNAYQPTRNGFSDIFITKLDAADGSLIFSTYLGGSRAERGYGVALNPAGDIYVTGASNFTDFPTTANAIQPSLNLTSCFCFDATVSVLSADGSSLLYSTYYGGALDDFGNDIDLDAAGNIFFAGETHSPDFPTVNPLQSTFAGGMQDGFVTRLSADGSTADYSTYLGGEDIEWIGGIDVDPAGYAHVGGTTASIGFPTTAGAYQPTFIGGINACGQPPFDPIRNCYDGFASKLAPDGSAFAYSTFLGGTDDDAANALALSADGSVYLAGYSYSDDFPGGGPALLFISRLDSTGSNLVYTVAPAVNSAAGHGAAVDDNGDVYVTGSNNVPADIYVIKLTEDIILPTPTPSPTSPPPPPRYDIYLPLSLSGN